MVAPSMKKVLNNIGKNQVCSLVRHSIDGGLGMTRDLKRQDRRVDNTEVLGAIHPMQ